jgi:hypothetical protein
MQCPSSPSEREAPLHFIKQKPTLSGNKQQQGSLPQVLPKAHNCGQYRTARREGGMRAWSKTRALYPPGSSRSVPGRTMVYPRPLPRSAFSPRRLCDSICALEAAGSSSVAAAAPAQLTRMKSVSSPPGSACAATTQSPLCIRYVTFLHVSLFLLYYDA